MEKLTTVENENFIAAFKAMSASVLIKVKWFMSLGILARAKAPYLS